MASTFRPAPLSAATHHQHQPSTSVIDEDDDEIVPLDLEYEMRDKASPPPSGAQQQQQACPPTPPMISTTSSTMHERHIPSSSSHHISSDKLHQRIQSAGHRRVSQHHHHHKTIASPTLTASVSPAGDIELTSGNLPPSSSQQQQQLSKTPSWAIAVILLLLCGVAFLLAFSAFSPHDVEPIQEFPSASLYCSSIKMVDAFVSVSFVPVSEVAERRKQQQEKQQQQQQQQHSAELSNEDDSKRTKPPVVYPLLRFSYLTPNLTFACSVSVVFHPRASVFSFLPGALESSCLGFLFNSSFSVMAPPSSYLSTSPDAAFFYNPHRNVVSFVIANRLNAPFVLLPCDRVSQVPAGVYKWSSNPGALLASQRVSITIHNNPKKPVVVGGGNSGKASTGTSKGGVSSSSSTLEPSSYFDISITDGVLAAKPTSCFEIPFVFSRETGQLTMAASDKAAMCLDRLRKDVFDSMRISLLFFHSKDRRLSLCLDSSCRPLYVASLF